MIEVECPAIDRQVSVEDPICKTGRPIKSPLPLVDDGARQFIESTGAFRKAHRASVERFGQTIQIGEGRIELVPTLKANSGASLHQIDGLLPGEAIYMPAAFEYESINAVTEAVTVGDGDHQSAVGFEHATD